MTKQLSIASAGNSAGRDLRVLKFDAPQFQMKFSGQPAALPTAKTSAASKLIAYTALNYAENIRFFADPIIGAVAEGGARLGAKLFGYQRSQADKDALASSSHLTERAMRWGWSQLTNNMAYSEFTNPTTPQNRRLWWTGLGVSIALPVLGAVGIAKFGELGSAVRWAGRNLLKIEPAAEKGALKLAKVVCSESSAFENGLAQKLGLSLSVPRGLLPELAASAPNAIFSAGRDSVNVLEKLLQPKNLRIFKKVELFENLDRLYSLGKRRINRALLNSDAPFTIMLRARGIGLWRKLFGESEFIQARTYNMLQDLARITFRDKYHPKREFFEATHSFIEKLKQNERAYRNYTFTNNLGANHLILHNLKEYIEALENIDLAIKQILSSEMHIETSHLRGAYHNLRQALLERNDFTEANEVLRTMADLFEEARRSSYLRQMEKYYK